MFDLQTASTTQMLLYLTALQCQVLALPKPSEAVRKACKELSDVIISIMDEDHQFIPRVPIEAAVKELKAALNK